MIKGHGDDAYLYGRPIKANFSSNVYGKVDLSGLKEHLGRHLDAVGSYPEPEPYTLEARLAALNGLKEAASVCVTNGATEAIYLIALAFRGSRTAILQPTFSEYADACRLHGHLITNIQAAQAGTLPEIPAGTDMLWLCNPNNPTGGVVPREELLAAIGSHPETVFVIDQSYGFFTRRELLSEAEAAAMPNVIQLHSMTKRYAMPGLRLGYITASPELLSRVRAVRMPWSVNAIAIEAGLYLSEHPEEAPIDLDSLLRESERLRGCLDAIPGVSAFRSETHFILCRLEKGSAAELKSHLAHERGLLIRDASNFEGLDERYFRIAAQTPQENDMLAEAIREYMEGRL